MGYCTIEDMRTLLPKNVTIGDDTITSPTLQPNSPGTGSASVVSTAIAQDSIKKASEEIDSALRSLYVCPLQRIKTIETSLIANASLGATLIQVRDNGMFDINCLVRISDDNQTELHYVAAMPTRTAANIHTVNLQEALTHAYNAALNGRVSILEYPDPVPLACARLAVGIAFDRIFVAEQQPDISSYGKTQRNLANQDLDRILTGVIRLEGQGHVGRRFARMSVMDTWKTPPEYTPGTYRDT